MSFFKFLRLARYKNMFNPFRTIAKYLMPWKSTFQLDDLFDLIVIFFTVLMISHMSACYWIYLGHVEDHLPQIERHTWRFNSDFGSDFEGYVDWQEYVFALYWVLVAVTTVGYGDYTGAPGNTNEYIFILFIECTGVGVYSVLIFKMQKFSKRKITYD